ncbi:HvfB family MNIO-type RiPP peptide maturase [Methylophaga sp.]|uniref:HvfB family MNIO-type RiPP peptide maturase n=1 Tax=Methylophaga sp. TaxID=2024840 RepID=UPI003F69F84A
MNSKSCPVKGAGLGFRRSFMDEFAALPETNVDFLEVAPENWMEMGGAFGRKFSAIAERYPMLCHGLSLSLGSPAPLDEHFLQRLKKFFDKHNIRTYSEHLSYCSDDGHLYDLMPIPFTEEAVRYVSDRIKRIQTILERRLVIENVSYYAAPGQQMSEVEFITAILEEADCDLLLDVNNVFVNSVNHQYDPMDYINAMPSDRIAYLHIAGHYNEADDLIVDTHGADVIDPVWQLLEKTYTSHGVVPTLLERDFNIPSVAHLLSEVEMIHDYQQQHKVKDVSHG